MISLIGKKGFLFAGVTAIAAAALVACFEQAGVESYGSAESNVEAVDPLEGAYVKVGGTELSFVFKKGEGAEKDSFLGEIDDNGTMKRAEGSAVVGRDNLGTTLTLSMDGVPKTRDGGTRTDGGGARDAGGAATTAGQTIFQNEIFPTLSSTCGSCHRAGGAGPTYLDDTAAESYALVKAKGFHLATSALLTQGAHAGPALTATQKAAIERWIAAEKPGNQGLTADGGVPAVDNRPLVERAFNGKMHFLKIGQNQTVLVRADASEKTSHLKRVKSWCREDSDCAPEVQKTGLTCAAPTCSTKHACVCD